MAKKKIVKKAAKKVTKKKTVAPKVVATRTKAPPKQEVDKVSYERELRKYVKRDGGFRKSISGVDKTWALYLMKLLGRKKAVWDKSIIPVS